MIVINLLEIINTFDINIVRSYIQLTIIMWLAFLKYTGLFNSKTLEKEQ